MHVQQVKGTTKQKEVIALIALPVLVERLGGEVTIAEAEFDAMHTRYGPAKLSVHATWTDHDRTLHLKVVATIDEQRAYSN